MFGYLLVITPPPSHFLIPEHHSSVPIESSLTQLTPSSSPHHLWLWLVQQSPCQYSYSYPPLFGLHSAARGSFLHHKTGHVTPTCLRKGLHSFHGSGDPPPTPPCQPMPPCSSSVFPVAPEFLPQGVSQALGNIHPFLPQCLCISCASAWDAYLETALFRCHFLNWWKPLEQSLQMELISSSLAAHSNSPLFLLRTLPISSPNCNYFVQMESLGRENMKDGMSTGCGIRQM